MKNKVCYAKEILEISCYGHKFAVDKRTGKIVTCHGLECTNCLFRDYKNERTCNDLKKEWAEAECEDQITADRLDGEFNKMCGGQSCVTCNYFGTNNCRFAWLLEHYEIKGRTNNE